MTRLLARWRVFLGFVFAAIVAWLATPTPQAFALGAAIAIVGESIRVIQKRWRVDGTRT
jgi:hypothetical protein